jgi:DNA-binding beta-propeller fold protein YncE
MSSGDREGRRPGRARRVAGAASGLIAAALLLWSTPALALTQRGHVFSPTLSFGGKGDGEGELAGPSGVAVSEVGATSGDIYVVDRGNNRVEQFDAAGEFVSAWGWGVKDGAKEYEVCLSGEGCQAGLPGSGKGKEGFHPNAGQLISPEAIAVDDSRSASDPSAGDVYVVADVVPEKAYVDKFSPTGEYLGHVTKKEETEFNGRPDGVAVDPSGVVWVDWSEGEITSFTDGQPNKRVDKGEEIESGVEDLRPGLAVDSSGHLYVDHEPGEGFKEAEEGPPSEEGRGENGEAPCELLPCYAAKLESTAEPGEVLSERVDRQNTTGVAVDHANGDVYLDNATSIAAYSAGGTLIQRFGAGHLTKGSGIAVEAEDRNVYVADAAADTIDVFVPEPAAAPEVDEISAAKITPSTAELAAEVDPKGAETTVTFEYGTASCDDGTCATVAASQPLEAGFGDQSASIQLEGLELSTTYHYRVTVHSASFGSVVSGERSFTTQSGAPFALPDDRAWELVSPPAKNGAGIEPITKEGGLIEAAEDGSRISYVAAGPTEAGAEGNRSPELTQVFSERVAPSGGKPEWLSRDITTPNQLATGIEAGQAPEYQFFSPDLSLALLRPKTAEPALSEEATEVTPYLRDDVNCERPPSTCYRPLVTGKQGVANVPPGTEFGGSQAQGGVQVLDATADMKHMVLESEVPLTSETAATGKNLYEWSEGQLKLINVLPEAGGAAPRANLGAVGNDIRHAISSDGSRVFWTASPLQDNAEETERLYMSDMTSGTSIRLDVAEAGVEEPVTEGASFDAASEDGSRVFFTDIKRLTAGSRASAESPDLYECEIVETAGKPACDLKDLTEDHNAGEEKAGVQGAVLGESEDGSSVYFVADGVLSTGENAQHEKAAPGECAPGAAASEATCNLYVEHYDQQARTWEAPRFIATLANADEPDWSTNNRQGELARMTSRVSPNGGYLAFMSERSLTGYDNRDVDSGALDEEVYLYDASTGGLVCASCNPSGGRPAGVFDTEVSGEGEGLVVDRPETWSERWIAGSIPGWTGVSVEHAPYQSRYLSDSGRLFFDSADALVPADENDKEDVYEYEPSGVGDCASEPGCVALISSGQSDKESTFLDASANGNDVFFLTAAPLVPTDTDTSFDVYDARVCETTSPCVNSSTSTSSSCETVAECRSAVASLPAFSPPATTAPSGSGNLAPAPTTKAPVIDKTVHASKPTRAQQLATALKACAKIKPKKKRLACLLQARKRYGPKKPAKKTSATSRKGRR